MTAVIWLMCKEIYLLFGITAAMIQSAQSKMKEAKSQLHTVNKERNNQEKIWIEELIICSKGLLSLYFYRTFNRYITLLEKKGIWFCITKKWMREVGGYNLYCYITVLRKMIYKIIYCRRLKKSKVFVQNISNIFLQDHF